MMERRSTNDAGTQIDWVQQVTGQGVGGRQAHAARTARGGGYLHECTPSQLLASGPDGPRLRELEEMGLPGMWLEMAHQIGYDNFLTVWRMLDAEYERGGESGSMIRLHMRRYSSFQRFQRNRFIESLAAEGLPDSVIRERVKCEIGDELSLSHIQRLMSGRKVGAA